MTPKVVFKWLQGLLLAIVLEISYLNSVFDVDPSNLFVFEKLNSCFEEEQLVGSLFMLSQLLKRTDI